jgi:hypothetical protein
VVFLADGRVVDELRDPTREAVLERMTRLDAARLDAAQLEANRLEAARLDAVAKD